MAGAEGTLEAQRLVEMRIDIASDLAQARELASAGFDLHAREGVPGIEAVLRLAGN